MPIICEADINNEYQKMKKSLITESNLITNFYADQKKKAT